VKLPQTTAAAKHRRRKPPLPQNTAAANHRCRKPPL